MRHLASYDSVGVAFGNGGRNSANLNIMLRFFLPVADSRQVKA
jgi:hypothetical protein